MNNRLVIGVFVGALVASALGLAAPPAAADIVTQSIDGDAQVLFPGDGQVFEVPSATATISITATASTWISYEARASLNVNTFDAEHATGGNLTHWVQFIFDSEVQNEYTNVYVPDSELDAEGIPTSEWVAHTRGLDPSVLSITLDVGVGWHFVSVMHEVYDPALEIHAIRNDFILFQVVAVPEPSTLALIGTALLAGGFGLRRGRRSKRRR